MIHPSFLLMFNPGNLFHDYYSCVLSVGVSNIPGDETTGKDNIFFYIFFDQHISTFLTLQHISH